MGTAQRTETRPKAVTCLVSKIYQVTHIVSALQREGFDQGAVSILKPPPAGTSSELSDDLDTLAPEGATVGVGAGAMIGGALGWLTGVGILAFPGLGMLSHVGPLLALLSGAALGATLGSMAGALIGMELPPYCIKPSADELHNSNGVLSVRAMNPGARYIARMIMEREGAEVLSFDDAERSARGSALAGREQPSGSAQSRTR